VKALTIISAMGLFPEFKGATWKAWRACLKAIFGLPLAKTEAKVYRTATGRTGAPAKPAREAWLAVGRRGGKSRMAALIAVYLACFRKYTLAPGEVGVVMCIASDRRQARVVLRYVLGLLDSVPMLSRLVARRLRESVVLSNGITIEVHTASFRSTRGYTLVGVVADEIAFWPTDDSANPDTEILNALRPGLMTIPGSLLVAISSPYARRGELNKAIEKHHGKDGDLVLTWMADTRTMNRSADLEEIERAFEEDEVAAWSEYGRDGEIRFRTDVETYVSPEVVKGATDVGVVERVPIPGAVAFCDPAGGSGKDSMTLGIAHNENGVAVLDLIREVKPPFSPEAVVAEFAETLKAWGIYSVRGDAFSGSFCSEMFSSKHGITFEAIAEPKSMIYARLLQPLNSGRVRLLDHPRLKAQLLGLERKPARGGRDSIDHAPRGHDDVINSAAGALVLAAREEVGWDGSQGLGVGWKQSIGSIGDPNRADVDGDRPVIGATIAYGPSPGRRGRRSPFR
jgi:hypothetical protein